MGYTGRCSCGQISLSISGEPAVARQCWCRHCQQIATGGPTHNAMFRTEDVAVTGQLASTSYVADSGNTLTAWFCPGCGCHIYAQSSARPHFRTVRLGVLDRPHGIRPQMIIWTAEAPEWAVFDPALTRFPGSAPAPQISK